MRHTQQCAALAAQVHDGRGRLLQRWGITGPPERSAELPPPWSSAVALSAGRVALGFSDGAICTVALPMAGAELARTPDAEAARHAERKSIRSAGDRQTWIHPSLQAGCAGLPAQG